MNIDLKINPNALHILNILQNRGFQAYIVGGAVRDIIMREPPNDFDICTDALPTQIKEIFNSFGFKTVLVGEKYGTVQVCVNGESFEATTFRTDNEYIDGRHPASVNFSKNIADDLKRRDFTINALACSVGKNNGEMTAINIIDIFGGMQDIENKIIRAVGDPCERFSEDALRMIRAVRFSAKLGFEIEPGTKSAICSLAEKISLVSKERISVEIEKILLSDNPEKFAELSDLNLLKYIMPSFDKKIKLNKLSAAKKIEFIKNLKKNFCVRFAALFNIYLLDEDMTGNEFELRDLRLKNLDIKNIGKIFEVVRLIRNNSESLSSKIFFKRLLCDFGKSVLDSALNITHILYDTEVDNIYNIIKEIELNGEPYKLSDLKINGDDIISLINNIDNIDSMDSIGKSCEGNTKSNKNNKNNKKIGLILSQCLEYVIQNPDKNTRAELIIFAEIIKNR